MAGRMSATLPSSLSLLQRLITAVHDLERYKPSRARAVLSITKGPLRHDPRLAVASVGSAAAVLTNGPRGVPWLPGYTSRPCRSYVGHLILEEEPAASSARPASHRGERRNEHRGSGRTSSAENHVRRRPVRDDVRRLDSIVIDPGDEPPALHDHGIGWRYPRCPICESAPGCREIVREYRPSL